VTDRSRRSTVSRTETIFVKGLQKSAPTDKDRTAMSTSSSSESEGKGDAMKMQQVEEGMPVSHDIDDDGRTPQRNGTSNG
jgi:hypothetical protein